MRLPDLQKKALRTVKETRLPTSSVWNQPQEVCVVPSVSMGFRRPSLRDAGQARKFAGRLDMARQAGGVPALGTRQCGRRARIHCGKGRERPQATAGGPAPCSA